MNTNVKRILLIALLAVCFILHGEARSLQPEEVLTQNIKYYEARIKALNLINGLYLDRDQLSAILDVLYDLQDYKQELMERAGEETRLLEKRYAELESDLLDDDIVDDRLETAARVQKNKLDNLEMQYRKKLVSFESVLNGIFTEKQLGIIEDYKPCVIPHKDTNNARIGQSDGADQRAITGMRRMRQLNRWEFEGAVSSMIARQINRMEQKKGIYGQQERDAEVERLSDLAWRIYDMDDVEFEVEKYDLAREMQPVAPKNVRKREQNMKMKDSNKQGNRVKRKNEIGKTGRLFLDVRLIDIFETKLENYAAR